MLSFLQNLLGWRRQEAELERTAAASKANLKETFRTKVVQGRRKKLRFKLEALHRRFQDYEKRLRKIHRTTQKNQGFAERYRDPVDTYVSKGELGQAHIGAQVRRLVDLPQEIETRNGQRVRIRFARRGWLDYEAFLRQVAEGKFPLYTLHQRPEGPSVQAVGWSSLVRIMTGTSPRIQDIPHHPARRLD